MRQKIILYFNAYCDVDNFGRRHREERAGCHQGPVETHDHNASSVKLNYRYKSSDETRLMIKSYSQKGFQNLSPPGLIKRHFR